MCSSAKPSRDAVKTRKKNRRTARGATEAPPSESTAYTRRVHPKGDDSGAKPGRRAGSKTPDWRLRSNCGGAASDETRRRLTLTA